MSKLQKRVLKTLLTLTFLVAIILRFSSFAYAAPPDELDYQESFVRGKVVEVVSQGLQTYQNIKTYNVTLSVQILEGKQKDSTVTIQYSVDAGALGNQQHINQDDTVVVDVKPDPSKKLTYSIYEPYRLDMLWWVLGAFVLLIVGIAGKKGLGAIIGLTISILVISLYLVPLIIAGADPLSVCITAALAILLLTTYVAHGISVKTTVALISTTLSLIIAVLLSIFCVHVTRLFGLGDENAYYLQLATTHPINPQGLLLGSILIGTLGALNDITTTQAITIFTLVKENPRQHFLHVFAKGMIIGREHIASLVNTLVLAYAGASLIVFIFFALNPAHLPWWVIINNETTMEEIIRAIVGSAALILAVPITTLFASFVALHINEFVQIIKNIEFQ